MSLPVPQPGRRLPYPLLKLKARRYLPTYLILSACVFADALRSCHIQLEAHAHNLQLPADLGLVECCRARYIDFIHCFVMNCSLSAAILSYLKSCVIKPATGLSLFAAHIKRFAVWAGKVEHGRGLRRSPPGRALNEHVLVHSASDIEINNHGIRIVTVVVFLPSQSSTSVSRCCRRSGHVCRARLCVGSTASSRLAAGVGVSESSR